MYVAPNERTYFVKEVEPDCSSRTNEGTRKLSKGKTATVLIHDNRTRDRKCSGALPGTTTDPYPAFDVSEVVRDSQGRLLVKESGYFESKELVHR